MILVFWHDKQEALRFYDTVAEAWVDMAGHYLGPTSLAMLVDWGWELLGEL